MIYSSSQHFHFGHSIAFVETKNELYAILTDLILTQNPDLICGYNIERESVGYINERAESIGIPNWYNNIARTNRPIQTWDDCRRITGRVCVNLWRIVNHKVDYRQYTLTTVAEKVLGAPFPEVKFATLSAWSKLAPARCATYYFNKLLTVVAIVNKTCVIEEYAELSTVIGLDFCSALSRGRLSSIHLLCGSVT
jgi:DNA polymerase zeta